MWPTMNFCLEVLDENCIFTTLISFKFKTSQIEHNYANKKKLKQVPQKKKKKTKNKVEASKYPLMDEANPIQN